MKQLIIALDFDETFTEDPDLWIPFVHHAKKQGHRVAFVTFRNGPETSTPHGNSDILGYAAQLEIEVVFTCHKQKRHVFPEADIWIDDMPHLIPTYGELKGMAHGCEVNGDTTNVRG